MVSFTNSPQLPIMRPSELERKAQCGSYEGKPGQGGYAAKVGVRAHEMMRGKLVGGVNVPDDDLTAQARFLYDRMVSAWDRICDEYDIDPGAYIEVEQKLDAKRFGNVEVTGTPDVHIHSRNGHGIVIDWKTGMKRFDASLQVATYMHLTGSYIGLVVWIREDQDAQIERVDSVPWNGGRLTVFDPDDLESGRSPRVSSIMPTILNHLGSAMNGPAKAGHWCYNCKHLGICDKAHALIGELKQFMEQWEDFDPADVAASLRSISVLEKQIEAAKESVREYIRENGPVEVEPGVELRLSTRRRKQVDGKALGTYMSRTLSGKEIMQCVKPDLTLLVKLKRGQAERGKKEAAEELITKELKDEGVLTYKEYQVLEERLMQADTAKPKAKKRKSAKKRKVGKK